jgi:hypothetical protein
MRVLSAHWHVQRQTNTRMKYAQRLGSRQVSLPWLANIARSEQYGFCCTTLGVRKHDARISPWQVRVLTSSFTIITPHQFAPRLFFLSSSFELQTPPTKKKYCGLTGPQAWEKWQAWYYQGPWTYGRRQETWLNHDGMRLLELQNRTL